MKSPDEEHVAYIHETLDGLIGGTVMAVQVTAMDCGAFGGAPTLVIQCRSGQRVRIEAWRDDEGNGPGALVCTHATKPKKQPLLQTDFNAGVQRGYRDIAKKNS